MAKKKLDESPIVNEYNPDLVPPEALVSYEDLILAKVQVVDKDGNLFYLDPAKRQGEFVLRVMPQPVEESTEPIPAEWIKPTAEAVKAASNAIDWGKPEAVEAVKEPAE